MSLSAGENVLPSTMQPGGKNGFVRGHSGRTPARPELAGGVGAQPHDGDTWAPGGESYATFRHAHTLISLPVSPQMTWSPITSPKASGANA